MTISDGVSGAGATTIPTALGFDANVTSMSPEALLDYCRMQLGDLDSQISDQMTQQKTSLREREAVQSAQSVLDQFGTAGPQNATDMAKCVDALNTAIAQLPQGDPVAAQLADFRDKMTSQYGYTPPAPPPDGLGLGAGDLTNITVASQDGIPNDGTLTNPPNANDKQWQGTTDALGAIADDVKSGAEIQMLQLQDLVSQRQQAVQLCSAMMTKTDQTLEEEAKAVGQ